VAPQLHADGLNRLQKTCKLIWKNECSAAAKKENVDLTKYSYDVDKLAFVPKTAAKKDDKK
ncbi:MAG: hypothetical protein WCA91_23960, partial [Candidatus Acidiferrales bacterium]